ncbi:hypothetical protein SK128_002374, partial [Halocaridina rubra]
VSFHGLIPKVLSPVPEEVEEEKKAVREKENELREAEAAQLFIMDRAPSINRERRKCS